ncbi:MAG: protein-disulfide isomerase [Acidimicrobiia bacterium]
MTNQFAVTWDYRCPFARNAHEHLIAGLKAGADWDVTFLPFSLTQAHVEEGQPSGWEEPEKDTGLIALMAGVVVRDRFPEQFLDVHQALFSARHDKGLRISEPQVVRDALTEAAADADAVFAEIEAGWPLKVVRTEHEQWVESHEVWGVPTFIAGESAVFIRFMHRPHGDGELAKTTINRVAGLLEWPELNEFKHTSLSR